MCVAVGILSILQYRGNISIWLLNSIVMRCCFVWNNGTVKKKKITSAGTGYDTVRIKADCRSSEI